MTRDTVAPHAIAWHNGPRAALRHLFELADDSTDQIDSYIEGGRVLAAVDDTNEIIGHAQLLPTDRPDTVELRSIAVLPDFQRRGVGRALVERVLAVGRDGGARAVTVTTATADIDNIRFYQRCGFRATSIERDAFTEAKGYPPGLEADGIPVCDSITFTLALDTDDACDQGAQPTHSIHSAWAARLLELRHHRKRGPSMITKALIVRLEAKSGQEETVADFLRDALPLVQQEPQTIAWFAFRIDGSSFAIVDVFPDEAGRRAHLDGAVAAALEEKGLELLAQPPLIESIDVIAAKLPLTVAATTIFNPRRELARRVGTAFEVTLFWDAADDTTSIEIWDAASHETLRFVVPPEDALDAFYHPFAHLRTAAAA